MTAKKLYNFCKHRELSVFCKYLELVPDIQKLEKKLGIDLKRENPKIELSKTGELARSFVLYDDKDACSFIG